MTNSIALDVPTETPAMTLSARAHVPDFVIEDHVRSTNKFIQISLLTLDDLNCYAGPLATAVQLVMRGAHDSVSDAEIVEVIRRAMNDYRSIDDGLDAENWLRGRAFGLAFGFYSVMEGVPKGGMEYASSIPTPDPQYKFLNIPNRFLSVL